MLDGRLEPAERSAIVKTGSLIVAILISYACFCHGSENGPRRISVKASNATELSRTISQQTGSNFVYLAADAQIAADFQQLPIDEVIEVLGQQGAVAFSSAPLKSSSAPEILLASRLSLSARSIDGQTLTELLARVSGDRIKFRPREAGGRLALDLKDLPISELPRALGELGFVTFSSPH